MKHSAFASAAPTTGTLNVAHKYLRSSLGEYQRELASPSDKSPFFMADIIRCKSGDIIRLLRPKFAQKRIDATHQALEALAALETDACMSAETKVALANTRIALARYEDSLKSDVEIGEKLARSSARRKKKG